MKLIIEIPDNYDLSKIQNGSIASRIILNAVANGTPVVIGTATWDYDNETCKYCGNNPKNGGSGVCHCSLATHKIT